MPPAGNIAFISQSGAMCLAILDRAAQEHIGFRHFVSIGSMLDVDFGDVLNYCCGDSGCRAIVLYVENITQARKFMSAARAVSRVKPIIVLKAGRSQAGAAAAYSHTGALAGTDEVYRAAFARAGITQVDTIEELFDCTELIAKQPIPTGPRLAVITNGGGPGVVAMDAIERLGLTPAQLSRDTLEQLDAALPAFWSRGNPIDIVGDAPPERWRRTLEICARDPGIDGLIIIYIPQALTTAGAIAATIIDHLKQKPKFPVFAVWMGGESVAQAVYQFNAQGYPTYDTPERAVAAFQRLHTHRVRQKMLQEIPGRFSAELLVDYKRARHFIDLTNDRFFTADMQNDTDCHSFLLGG
jgi:acetyltransferase